MLRFPRHSADGRMAGLVVVAGFLAMACGSQSDSDIPPELIEALKQTANAPQYPTGTTGGELGDVATDICFDGWENPTRAEFDLAALEQRCLHDYYDPNGESHSLLFVVSSAIWCQACQTEFGGSTSEPPLSEQVTTRYAAGLRAFGGLFQNAAGDPATAEDAQRWAQTFGVAFPFGLDDAFTLGRFAKVNAQPLHMLVDTRDMTIVYKATGGNIQLLWTEVDRRLSATRED